MHVLCRRNVEGRWRTYANEEIACKLHTESFLDQQLNLWLSCYKAAGLTGATLSPLRPLAAVMLCDTIEEEGARQ